MPEPTTVWMVHLARGESPDGTRGTLKIEGATVVFTDQDLRPTRFHSSIVRKARRLRGSPVLELQWVDDGSLRRTAFYFVQPPPLVKDRGTEPPPETRMSGRPLGAFGTLRRSSKRRQMRTNAGYLQTFSSERRHVIQAWADEIAAMLDAKDGQEG